MRHNQLILLLGFTALLFQNCANVGFNDEPAVAEPEQAVVTAVAPEPVAPAPVPTTPTSSCVGHAGTACVKTVLRELPGCREHYGCSYFTGVYYNSPNGCDPATASSYVEYSSDGVEDWVRSSNDHGQLHKNSKNYRCTYVGFAAYDPFKGAPNGNCVKATGYSIPHTYTRVIPGANCTHQAHVETAGVVACDGSCK